MTAIINALIILSPVVLMALAIVLEPLFNRKD